MGADTIISDVKAWRPLCKNGWCSGLLAWMGNLHAQNWFKRNVTVWQRRLESWPTPLFMPPCLLFAPIWLHLAISLAKLPTYLWKFIIFNEIKSSRNSVRHTSANFCFAIHNSYFVRQGCIFCDFWWFWPSQFIVLRVRIVFFVILVVLSFVVYILAS